MWREAINLTFAGPNSTAAGLTACLWELGRHPEWQERLRQKHRVEGKAVRLAFIKETLRLHAPFPTSFPRVVAQNGIDGSVIPGLKASLPVSLL